ncbi:MAG: anion transporter [Spirochaetaceae bacterium]|nr:anion transporter [Spirochaetaceae bacterium]
MSNALAVYIVLMLAFFGIASGRLPRLAMNRASIALTAAIVLVALGGIAPERALQAVDVETLALLLAMMIIVANLRVSGFFSFAGARILSVASSPRSLLALVVAASGLLSALFLNDTICIMLTPLLAEILKRAKRDARPYLIALATAANAGSCATPIGNPQNMLIASQSGIPFSTFLLSLGPPSILAMLASYGVTLLAFPDEFRDHSIRTQVVGAAAPDAEAAYSAVDRLLMLKSLAASALLLVLLLAGVRTSLAALIAAAVLMLTRRINPEHIFAEVDFTLLVFFSGLFVLTAEVASTELFARLMQMAMPLLHRPGALFAGITTLASNLVSNVPAVMLLSPAAKAMPEPAPAWLMLAMASTFAGNLTLLGSVANLIVAEQAGKAGLRMGFLDYLKVGLPVTLISVMAGTAWLGLLFR